jgi:hypothetical protein
LRWLVKILPGENMLVVALESRISVVAGTERGPEHMDLLATTSASSDKSANSTFGCALIFCHASLVGIKFEGALEADGSEDNEGDGDGHFVQFEALPQHLEEVEPMAEGQSSQTSPLEDACAIASQNAFPKSSSPHAGQFEGSPEQDISTTLPDL